MKVSSLKKCLIFRNNYNNNEIRATEKETRLKIYTNESIYIGEIIRIYDDDSFVLNTEKGQEVIHLTDIVEIYYTD